MFLFCSVPLGDFFLSNLHLFIVYIEIESFQLGKNLVLNKIHFLSFFFFNTKTILNIYFMCLVLLFVNVYFIVLKIG